MYSNKKTSSRTGAWFSALLVAALAGGDIDGALVTRPSADPQPWKGVSHLATTAKEIVDAAGSYYNQTMALAELDLSKYDLPRKPRIPWWGRRVRSRGSGPCSRAAGRPGPTGSTRWS